MEALETELAAFSEQIRETFSLGNPFPTLRVCVTEKCNIQCFYCHREGMKNGFSRQLSLEEYASLAKTFHEIGFKKVKFTGGEPLLCQELSASITIFKKAGFEDISLVTNGILLNEQKLTELKKAGLGRITISIDSIRKKTSLLISNGNHIEESLANAVLARNYFEPVKINCVILPGYNFPGELLELANFCRDNGLVLKLLSRLSEELMNPLSLQALSIIKSYKNLSKREIHSQGFVPSTRYFFSDGTIIEINDFRNDEYRKCSDPLYVRTTF